MLEAMNERLVQAEATAAATSQNAGHSLDLSSSLAMPDMWSSFPASAQTPTDSFMSPHVSFPTGHARRTPRDEGTMTGMSPATIGIGGETMRTHQ
ncbi:uncharacterized protein PG986_004270 [Apiospora aurea]|uniref:Uncharacterized protein n=1 Tax=Apiospora aurea TaxID=335848 RepID=A0ABR1QM40_9PEZI